MFYLQLRNKLWKLFAKKRTYIGFLMFLLAQNVIILVFRFTNGPRVSMMRTLEGSGYLAPEHLAVHVRPADSVVEDWRVAQHFAWIQSHVLVIGATAFHVRDIKS